MASVLVLIPPPVLPQHLDRGLLVLVAALFLASILAHRHWRARIRLEDELAKQARDMAWSLHRFRAAWRHLEAPAAFADRHSGLVVDATPGWAASGLPAAGERLSRGDAFEAAWSGLVPPEGEADGASVTLVLEGRAFLVRPLAGASLGLVLVVPQ